MTSIQKLAQLHSIAGTQRFLYKDFRDTVMLVQLDPQSNFKGSSDLNKNAARKVWDALVSQGWSTKKMAA